MLACAPSRPTPALHGEGVEHHRFLLCEAREAGLAGCIGNASTEAGTRSTLDELTDWTQWADQILVV
jgi:hypothetical protein